MAWLLRITRNRAIDWLRRRKRQGRKSNATALWRGGRRLDRPVEPNEAATPGWHVHESVHAGPSRAPRGPSAVVRLAYFEGLTHSEIAHGSASPLAQ